MKKEIGIILMLGILCSCSDQVKRENRQMKKINTTQPTNKSNEEIRVVKNTGEKLFTKILDTVTSKPVTIQLLRENQWAYKPFDNCLSYLKFEQNGKGISFNCEMEEEYEMTYQIDGLKIYVSEFDIPHTDNAEQRRIKSRTDTYIYNGESLIMVDSKMYNIPGMSWTPEIEVVINYKRMNN